MDQKRQILGKTLSCTAMEALLLLEASYCEGMILPSRLPQPGVEQLYGRKTQFHYSKDLSFISGIAGGGLRTAAIMHAANLTDNLNRLREMARNHIPALIICLTDFSTTGRVPMAALKDSGCFILSASSVQEAIHLAIVGHVAAEQALTPGILLLEVPDDAAAKFDIVFPEAALVSSLLGDPDDAIASPNPAQQMIFGKNRRRIPNWYHFDYPTLSGVPKTGLPAALEQAANAQFFDRSLPEIIEKAFDHYCEAVPETEGALLTYQTNKSDYLLLCSGAVYNASTAVASRLRADSGIRAGCVHLAQVHPLPLAALANLFTGKKAVTWLHPGSAQNDILPLETLQSLGAKSGKNAPEWFRGKLATQADASALMAIFQNMLPKGEKKQAFFSGVEFIRTSSEYPQHEMLLQSLRRNFPEASTWSLLADSKPITSLPASEHKRLPMAIRHQKDLSPPYARTARFYHDFTAPYADGAYHELVADPYQAIPQAPLGTAGLADGPKESGTLPVFKPELCTGCGECLVHCPHAALPPLVINVEKLLRGGMEIAKKQGRPLSQLTPLLKNLGKIAGQIITANTAPLKNVADFLPAAFSRLADQMKMDAEKLEKNKSEIEILGEVLAPLSISATETFFTQSEQQEKGSGELFSLALDTQACTGCGICTAVCEPAALEMSPDTPALRTQAGAALDIWEQLPDTAPASILRRHHDEAYNPFAAILLSRHNYCSLSGPGKAAAAPRKALIHLITSLTESIVQPNVAAQCREIEQLVTDLSDNIRKILGAALPADGSEALEAAIKSAEGRKLPLDEIMGKLSTHEHRTLVDTADIQRKIQLENDLKDLLWSLKEGPTGAGRARYGLFFSGEQAPADDYFPYHPFQAPTRISPSSSPDMGLGMFEAQLRHSIDNIRLLRRAKLEIKNQYRPEIHAASIASLDWNQLEDAEKQLVAPLVFICRREHLPTDFIHQIPHILAQHYPLKIIVLDNGALQPEEAPEITFSLRNTLLQAAQSSGHARVFMGSSGNPQVLFNGLLHGMRTQEPALFVLYCPEPVIHRDAEATWHNLPKLALDSRAVPFFQWDPEQAGLTRAAGISLEGNPSEQASWAISGKDESKTGITFADWLFSLRDWQDHFREVSDTALQLCPLHEYLELEAAAQEGKTAVIYRTGADGVAVTYALTDQVLDACRAALSAWNYLREIAGALSMHPQKLWDAAEEKLGARYDAQLQEMEKGFEERIKHLEQEFMEKTRVQLREKLLALARNSS